MPFLSLLTVEPNEVKIWKISTENGTTILEEQYCIAIHKDIISAVHRKNQIILAMAENLNVTLDEQLEYIAKVDMKLPPICHLATWDLNVIYFCKTGSMYLFEQEK